jgi:hypothetical protein
VNRHSTITKRYEIKVAPAHLLEYLRGKFAVEIPEDADIRTPSYSYSFCGSVSGYLRTVTVSWSETVSEEDELDAKT